MRSLWSGSIVAGFLLSAIETVIGLTIFYSLDFIAGWGLGVLEGSLDWGWGVVVGGWGWLVGVVFGGWEGYLLGSDETGDCFLGSTFWPDAEGLFGVVCASFYTAEGCFWAKDWAGPGSGSGSL